MRAHGREDEQQNFAQMKAGLVENSLRRRAVLAQSWGDAEPAGERHPVTVQGSLLLANRRHGTVVKLLVQKDSREKWANCGKSVCGCKTGPTGEGGSIGSSWRSACADDSRVARLTAAGRPEMVRGNSSCASSLKGEGAGASGGGAASRGGSASRTSAMADNPPDGPG
eukprot:6179540-Pleurochrysis_carterae.AAC.7